MREIKFRIWDKRIEDGIMSYDDGHFNLSAHGEVYCVNEGYEITDHVNLMQYTGLKDVNGVEIYEKDHVLIRGAGNTVYLRTIEFEQGTFHFGNIKDGMCDYRDMEVVGNAFEGTYLLEG